MNSIPVFNSKKNNNEKKQNFSFTYKHKFVKRTSSLESDMIFLKISNINLRDF